MKVCIASIAGLVPVGPTVQTTLLSTVDTPPAAFKFRIGSHSVVPGFAEAVSSMTVGGKRIALLPPAVAYGARGMPSFGIAPGTTLLYYIEVIEGSRA